MERQRCQIFFEEPSRTKQAFKDECDINKIMKRFKNEMGTDYLTRYQGIVSGRFEDVSDVVDYRTSLERVQRAEEAFMALPAQIRKRFRNDAGEFLDFVQNPENADELVSMGLARKQDSQTQDESVATE